MLLIYTVFLDKFINMAKNTGSEFRQGAVKDRTQTYNSKTNCYIKRDSTTGKFLSVKKDEPYKGITKETSITKKN